MAHQAIHSFVAHLLCPLVSLTIVLCTRYRLCRWWPPTSYVRPSRFATRLDKDSDLNLRTIYRVTASHRLIPLIDAWLGMSLICDVMLAYVHPIVYMQAL